MIAAIISVLEQVAPQVGMAYGLCTIETDDQKQSTVIQYVGGGQARRVEGTSWSYWRVTAPIKQRRVNEISGCEGSTGYGFALRYVICSERELCGPDQLNGVSNAMRRSTRAMEQATSAMMVNVGQFSVEIDPAKASKEYCDKPVPLGFSIAYIDLNLEIVGDNCIDDCAVAAVPPDPAVCVGVDIFNNDGSLLIHLDDGSEYTLPEADMPYLAAIYATEADALADTTTVPDDDQAIKVAGRLYQGDGASSSSDLVVAGTFNPSVTEDPATGLHTTFDGVDALIQLTAP